MENAIDLAPQLITSPAPGRITDKKALATAHSLEVAKLARDEHHLILYTDGA